VAAHAGLRVPLDAVAELRRHPGPVCGGPLPPAFLKHADEQTVIGLAAVYHAIHDHHLSPPFTAWGVLAAPRFLGRPTMAAALQRFAAEGAWGVSPHLIPHRSLHAMSGTVSQALKIHGPNFGVGGGPSAAVEALLAAAALLERQNVPGVWVVLTGLDPEKAPDESGRTVPGIQCVGVALALVPPRVGWPGIRLRVVAGEPMLNGSARHGLAPSAFDLVQLHSVLTVQSSSRPAAGFVQMIEDAPGLGSRIELSRSAEPGERLPGAASRSRAANRSAVGASLSAIPSCVEAEH
jgi:hypothetical protein